MGEVDVAERKRAGDEGFVAGVELALDPVRPDPVEVVLDGLGVYEAARMEKHAGAKKLDGFGDLGGLGEAAHPRKQADRVEKTVCTRGAGDKGANRPGVEQHTRGSFPAIVRNPP